MRFPVALGLFLMIGGCMVLVLHPVYRTGERVVQQGLEADGPTEIYRPMPDWLGLTMVITGGALLIGARARRL